MQPYPMEQTLRIGTSGDKPTALHIAAILMNLFTPLPCLGADVQ